MYLMLVYKSSPTLHRPMLPDFQQGDTASPRRLSPVCAVGAHDAIFVGLPACRIFTARRLSMYKRVTFKFSIYHKLGY
jgi:hypothetical protein